MATGAPATDRSFLDKISWPFLTAAVGSLVTLAASFGLEVSAEQLAAINLFVASAASLIARQKVTPWKPDAADGWSAETLAASAETVRVKPEDTEGEAA